MAVLAARAFIGNGSCERLWIRNLAHVEILVSLTGAGIQFEFDLCEGFVVNCEHE